MPKKIAHPRIASRTAWLAERKQHLRREKKVTHAYDRLAAARRRLPMVKLEKDYVFQGPGGKKNLAALFGGKRQLIVYHFMFDPAWTKGCPGCTGFVDALGDLSLLDERDTAFVLISRATLAKLQAYKKKRGWDRKWFSSFGSDFNYDFHVTLDESVQPIEYNYRTQKEWIVRGSHAAAAAGESHGLSVFFRLEDDVYHTYSSYGRGVECLTDAYSLLDVTPYGRQEDWEDSPRGWPQRPTYG